MIRAIILVLSLVAVGSSLWLMIIDLRVAHSGGLWQQLNWFGRALARAGAAVIMVEIGKLVYRTLDLSWNADVIAYTVGLAGYTIGTFLSLIALHPLEDKEAKARP